MKTLAKIQQDKMIAGVCSGFAYAFAIPAWIIRISAALLFMAYGVGILAYILLWIFMPKWHVDPQDYAERTRVAPPPPAA